MLRPVYMVLSPRSLDYARLTIATLLQQCDEQIALTLITDSADDRRTLEDALATIDVSRHATRVFSEDDLADVEAQRFALFPNLRAFRHGHPCWRKITDPVLCSTPGEEMVLLDPDLFFPNRFRFEQTPASGLLLMWQQPNCLLPAETVRAALDADIPLARHVDIGVSHWRVAQDAREFEWLDWLLGKLGGPSLPRMMHVEAIVWSALAMQFGGGYLDPALWVCWRRTQAKRVRRKLGADGKALLRSEPWGRMKCFHAGGEAKWWLADAQQLALSSAGRDCTARGRILPFTALSPTRYTCEQMTKNAVGYLGYYRLFGANRA